MPLPSSRNLSRKLGKSGSKDISGIVEDLKQHHANELARANEEHAKKVEQLQHEVEQCRAEIELLKALSDEGSDKLGPLPSPSKSLKFVKNTQLRKARKGLPDKNVASMIADLKTKHSKDLAVAAETYANKLQVLREEVDKCKAETEALKASGIRDGGKRNRHSAYLKGGAAAHDKENIAHEKVVNRNLPASPLKSKQQSGDRKSSCESERLDGLGNLRGKYEQLFQEDYQLEKDYAAEEALASRSYGTERHVNSENIHEMCKDLDAFVADIKLNDLSK